MKNIQMKNQRSKAAGSGQGRVRDRAQRTVYYTPEDITLKQLAALGVERGLRFLDAYGKILFGRS
jgi:hypothetical protein